MNIFSKNNEIQNQNETVAFNLTTFGCCNTTLNKTITLEEGKLCKISNGQFAVGVVEVLDCGGLSGFKGLLEQEHNELAFTMGQPHRDGEWLKKANVTTKDKIKVNTDPNTIARTKDHFAFKPGEPSLLLFDIDGFGGTVDELLTTLHDIDPQLRDAECLVVASSSSHIVREDTGKPMSGGTGYHVYFIAEDGADIPRYGEVFAQRAWLKGHGFYKISSDGKLHKRQIIDSAVYSPERLIFEAPPSLGAGLIQKRPPIHYLSGGLVKTSDLHDLTGVEQGELSRIEWEVKKSRLDEAKPVHERYADTEARKIVDSTGCDYESARKAVHQLSETSQLPDSFTLKFDDFGLVLVADVLADPEKYDNRSMADPTEHDYNGGRNIAMFYWNDGNPRIHSFARHGKHFTFTSFESGEASLKTAIKASRDDPGAHWQPAVMDAARKLLNSDRASFQRLRAQLKKNCPEARVTDWERELKKRSKAEGGDRHVDIARELVNFVNLNSELFHDEKDNGYVTIAVDKHRETWLLESDGFKDWLKLMAYREFEKVPCSSTIESVISTLNGQARYDGKLHDVYIRCAPYGDGYVVDLTNDRWDVIHVTDSGWEVLTESPVKFIRAANATALPTPTNGFIDQFWSHVNIPEEDRTLVLAFMLESLRPDTDFPILELSGEQGTGKSSTHTRIRQLTDPNSTPLRSAPKDREDVFVAVGKNWQASFENMSFLSDSIQDALCTLATGGGFSTRKLFTNMEESVIDAKRPIIINGITSVATRPDLIDRIVHVELPRLEENASKKDLEVCFEREYPEIFAGFLNVFSATLRRLPKVRLERLPRMADFALLGQALHDALGEKHPFMDIFERNRSDSLHVSLEASPVALALWELAKKRGEWTGTTKSLLEELESFRIGGAGWVTSPKGLGTIIERLGPALREVGVYIETKRTREGYVRTITYVPSEEDSAGNKVHNVHKVHLLKEVAKF